MKSCHFDRTRLPRRNRVIAIVEEETPRAPAGLLEATLRLLVQGLAPAIQKQPEVSVSVQRIRELRPALGSGVILLPKWLMNVREKFAIARTRSPTRESRVLPRTVGRLDRGNRD